MSWFSDALSNIGRGSNDVAKFFLQQVGGNATNDLQQFIQREIGDKADLRGAQVESMMSGLPVVGGLLKGVEGAERLEDLYNNAGKTPAYPALNNSGASAAGIGKSIPGLSRKIESGINDLYEFYTGERDVTIESLHKQGILQYGDEL